MSLTDEKQDAMERKVKWGLLQLKRLLQGLCTLAVLVLKWFVDCCSVSFSQLKLWVNGKSERHGPYVVKERGIFRRVALSWFGLYVLVLFVWCSLGAVLRQKGTISVGLTTSSVTVRTGSMKSTPFIAFLSHADVDLVLNATAFGPVSPPVCPLSFDEQSGRLFDLESDGAARSSVALSLIPERAGATLPKDLVRGLAFPTRQYVFGFVNMARTPRLCLRLDDWKKGVLVGSTGVAAGGWSVLSLALHTDKATTKVLGSSAVPSSAVVVWRGDATPSILGSAVVFVPPRPRRNGGCCDWLLSWLLVAGLCWLIVDKCWVAFFGAGRSNDGNGCGDFVDLGPEDVVPEEDPVVAVAPPRRRGRKKAAVTTGQGRTRPYLHRAGKERPRTRPYLARAAKSKAGGKMPR